ncbi:MAG: hypothetical protein R6W90_02595 [Ignavibacteriaceae bacterium]
MNRIKVIFFIAAAVMIMSCDIKDPVEGLEVRLNSLSRETLVTAYVYDAKTGNIVEQEVSVTFTGSNAAQIIDETNFPKDNFSAENGFFNFGIMDGTVLNSSNPLKVIAELRSAGYRDARYPISFTSKGIQAVTFFLAREEDFQGDITSNNIQSGSADNSGTVTATVNSTSGDGTTVMIPAGTILQTSSGAPLTGGLNTEISTTIYNGQTTTLLPGSLKVSATSSIVPLLSFSAIIRDAGGNTAGTVADGVKFYIPLTSNLLNPVTGSSYQVGDIIRTWKLNSAGNYIEASPANVVDQQPSGSLGKTNAVTGLEISGNPDLIGDAAETCELDINISNPREGFNLQVFRNNTLVQSSASIPSTLTLSRNTNDPAETYEFKFGANPATGQGGVLYASYTSPAGCGSGSASVSFTYPTETIRAAMNINGVCTSRDPVIRVYPSITFNYRVKGTGSWQQGSLSNGQTVIAGLLPNTLYEATTTYRDKEASIDINVVNAGNFEIIQSSAQGALLKAEVTGTSSVNGESAVNIDIDIDLKDDCD